MLQNTSPVVQNTHDSVDWLGGSFAGFAMGQSPECIHLEGGGLAGRPNVASVTRPSGSSCWQVAEPWSPPRDHSTSLRQDWLPNDNPKAAVSKS